MTPDATGREAAWEAVDEALPARWLVGLPSFDPEALRADGFLGAWSVTARGPHPGRGKHPQTVSGTGEDETAALRDLDDRLRGVSQPDRGRLEELRRRMRLAYLQGAEDHSRKRVGRALTIDEQSGVMRRFPGR